MKNKIILLISSLLFFVGFASANLQITPLKFEYEIMTGGTQTGIIKVKNTANEAVTVYVSKEDFLAGDETGTPRFIKPGEEGYGVYGLSNWLILDEDHMTLSPGETREFRFVVNVPKDGEPGGHYGAIFFSPGPSAGQVSLIARLGVLFLIDVPGELVIDGKVDNWKIGQVESDSFVEKNAFNSLPISFPVRFINNGNVHIKPNGKITLLDEDGNQLKNIGKQTLTNEQGVYLGEELVDFIPVNDEGGNVLPDSARTFDNIWQGFGYQILNEDGTRGVKFKDLQGYFDEKAAENKKYLKFWEDIREVNVKRKIIAQLNVSFEGQDGQQNQYNDQKEFYITYKESQIVWNWYVVLLAILIIGFVLYNIFIGRKKKEQKLREKFLNEMKQKSKPSSIPVKKKSSKK